MAGVHETACQRITTDDIDDVFFTLSNAEEQTMKE
jgi:hypothetical protein